MATLLEVVSFVKEVAVILGAAVAAYVALRGLSTWNRKLKGGIEYELARRVLRSAYRLRESVREARNPTVFGRPEPPLEGKESKSETTTQDRIYAEYSREYKDRCGRITDAASELRAELIESEVLWGKELREIALPLFDLQSRLLRRIEAYLVTMNPNETSQDRRSVREVINRHPEIMYNLSIVEEPDPFWSDFSSAVGKLEDALRSHLRK